MESFFEFLLEFVVQVFGEAILDALFRSRNPAANTAGVVIVASIYAGLLAALSLVVHPHHFISSRGLRIAALVVLPLVNGGLMSFIGHRFIRLGRPRSGYEHFFPAFAFSLVFGMIRFAAAT